MKLPIAVAILFFSLYIFLGDIALPLILGTVILSILVEYLLDLLVYFTGEDKIYNAPYRRMK
jgi:hypothetical protein